MVVTGTAAVAAAVCDDWRLTVGEGTEWSVSENDRAMIDARQCEGAREYRGDRPKSGSA